MRSLLRQLLALPLPALLPLLVGCGTELERPVYASTSERPHVFLIVIDTLRADRLGCYGWDRDTSPRLDRLAREGARFADVTSQSSWTKPSMVSMFTGQYVTAYQDAYGEDQVTLAQHLGSAGYKSLGVVGNVLLSRVEGFDRGFDDYDARALTVAERAERAAQGGSDGPSRDIHELTAQLLAQIDAHLASGDGRPVFGYLHPMEPHYLYLAHTELLDELPFDSERDPMPSPWHAEQYAAYPHPAPADDPGWENSWRTLANWRARYEREIRYADDALAEFLTALETRGLLENAIVAVVSDHGEGLFDHVDLRTRVELAQDSPLDYFQKQHGRHLYQELVATPMILWGAGVPAGTVVESAVENVDLVPTLLELLDLADPGALHGESLVDALYGGEVASEDVHSFVLQNMMVRRGHMKLVLPTRQGVAVGARKLLFDLSSDPRERTNLFEQRPAARDELVRLMADWQAAHPTVSNHGAMKDATTVEHLEALGYGGGD